MWSAGGVGGSAKGCGALRIVGQSALNGTYCARLGRRGRLLWPICGSTWSTAGLSDGRSRRGTLCSIFVSRCCVGSLLRPAREANISLLEFNEWCAVGKSLQPSLASPRFGERRWRTADIHVRGVMCASHLRKVSVGRCRSLVRPARGSGGIKIGRGGGSTGGGGGCPSSSTSGNARRRRA